MERYFEAVKKDSETIRDTTAFSQKESINLEDIYVPLKLKEVLQEPDSIIKKDHVINPETALNNYHHLVISGPPGAGKTTLLKYLALNTCKENIETQEYSRIPIPIPLREFSESGKNLEEYIDTVLEKYKAPDEKKRVEKVLETGKSLLLMDGFDEITFERNREKVIENIYAFTEIYRGCKIVVTSRQREPFKGFTRMEVMEFDNNGIKEFIDNRFGIFNRVKSEAMFKMIINDKGVGTLARNPLMISIMAALYDEAEDQEQLPKRADLYQRIIDVMFFKWDVHKKINPQFSAEKKIFILRKLAFQDHHRNQRIMTRRDIVEEIDWHSSQLNLKKEEYRPFFEEICRRNCILRQLSTGTYEFIAPCFQEYFAALELKEQEDGIATAIAHLPEARWEGPILFYAGISKDASNLVRRIQKEVPEDIFYSNLILSGNCIAEAAVTNPLLKEEIVRTLWLLYNNGEYQLLKEKAIDVLARLKPSSIIDVLADQLTDKEFHIRRLAVETLGLIGNVEALPALIMVLVKDKESKIRCHAAEALGQIGGPEVIHPLINALNIDEEDEVRRSAAEALGLIGNPEAIPALIQALTMDKAGMVRGGAAEALGKIGGNVVLLPLIQALTNEKDTSVRWRIAISLGELQSTVDTDARGVLIEALATDRDKEVRESAAEALGLIEGTGDAENPECVTALIKALSLDEDADVRGSAAYALGYIKSKEALPALIKALISDTNGEVRGRAAYALGRIKNIKALPYLSAVFNAHRESLIRGNAAYALGEIGGAEAIPFLIRALLSDKDSYVRYRAAEVLGSIGDVATISPLKTALKDDGSYYGWKVKDKAFEALEKICRRLQVRIF